MSAQVDVLAVMDRASHLLPGSKGAVVTKIELSESRAAVAELIEASAGYVAARNAVDADRVGRRAVYERADVARARFDAALARVKGVQS